MSKPRLGVRFGATLYPDILRRGESPDLERPPRSGAIERLVRCITSYDIHLYPEHQHPGRASAIQGWLLTQLRRYFERAEVDDPSGRAEQTVEAIHVCELRPGRLDREVEGDETWPSDGEIRDLWQDELA
jgi:hypothetical protein